MCGVMPGTAGDGRDLSTSSGKQSWMPSPQGEGSARSRHFRKEGRTRKNGADRPVSPVSLLQKSGDLDDTAVEHAHGLPRLYSGEKLVA